MSDEYTRARLIGIAQRALADSLDTFFDEHADAETLLRASAAVVAALDARGALREPSCEACGGSGYSPQMTPCPSCHGSGLQADG